jgi:hypothetical protein
VNIDDGCKRQPVCICEDDDDPQTLTEAPGCPVHDPDFAEEPAP